MSTAALALALGCSVVLSPADFPGGDFDGSDGWTVFPNENLPVAKGWPNFPGHTVICFEPGVYPNVTGWAPGGGTVEAPQQYVALITDKPWNLPYNERVVWPGYISIRNSHSYLKGFYQDRRGFFVNSLTVGWSTIPTNVRALDHWIEGGKDAYSVIVYENGYIDGMLLGPADQLLPGVDANTNSGGFSIVGSNITIRNVEVRDRGEDCFQVHAFENDYHNILIEDFDCGITDRTYYVDQAGGVRACAENAFDLKTGRAHANYAPGDENIIRRGNIYGFRAAGNCTLGGGAGSAIQLHGPNTQHWVVEDVNIWDSDVCVTQTVQSGGTATYFTFNRVRCLNPHRDATNVGWTMSLPQHSEIINSTIANAPDRWFAFLEADRSFRCNNVINSAAKKGDPLPIDMRRTHYYGDTPSSNDTKRGESVVWKRPTLVDLTIHHRRFTDPDAFVTLRNVEPERDWRNVIWGATCDPGASIPVGAFVTP